MRTFVFRPLYALVVFTLLLSVMPMAMAAQPPPPNPCPEGQAPDTNGVCVPVEETGQPEEPPPVAIELPAGNLASFTLYHLACDDDFDPNGVRDGGGLGPANGCLTFGKPPFSYSISANGIPIASATLDATERDVARFDVTAPIPAGTLTITVAPVTDYTTEFISCGLEIGEAGTDVIEPPIAGGTATFSTLPDQKVECWVYNVTREGGEEGEDPVVDEEVVVDDSTGPGADITIATYNCPAGTDTEERSFMLTLDGDTMGQTVTGSATWEFLDPTIAADIGPAVVSSAWCTSEWVEIGDETIDIPDEVILDSGLLTVTVTHPATAVHCDWYLFPSQGRDGHDALDLAYGRTPVAYRIWQTRVQGRPPSIVAGGADNRLDQILVGQFP